MLKITPTTGSGNMIRYHRDMVVLEDVATGEENGKGVWGGKAAKALGLEGPVFGRQYNNLCRNLHPESATPLTPRNRADRRVAYDFTFSVPKSVTLLWALGHDERIRELFVDSVRATMAKIEPEASTRVRVAGSDEDRLTENLVWAEFLHHSARPVNGVADPHLHTHVVVLNATHDDAEKRWKAVQLGHIKRDAPYYEALFLSDVAKGLSELGYSITSKGKYWEIDGVQAAMVERFSNRTDQIEFETAGRGVTAPDEKASMGLKTREKKGKEIAEPTLREAWQERISEAEAAAFARLKRDASEKLAHAEREGDHSGLGTGFKRDRYDSRSTDRDTNENLERASKKAREAARIAMERVFGRDAVVHEKRLLAEALKIAPGEASVEQFRDEFKRLGVITKPMPTGPTVTTREVLDLEKKMVKMTVDGQGMFRPLSDRPIEPGRTGLSDEQLRAANHVLSSKDFVTLVEGPSGTGKTTAFHAVREELSKRPLNGLLPERLIVLSPASQASRESLRKDGFDKAETVAKFLSETQRHSFARTVSEHVQDRVVWVDEGSLLGTRSMVEVMERCRSNGWRLVVTHDPAQHQAVERGSSVNILKEHAGLEAAKRDDSRRQQGEYKRAVEALARGEVNAGASRLQKMGALKETERGEVAKAAAKDYVESVKSGKKTLAVAATRADKDEVCREVRKRLQAEGELKKERAFTRLTWVEGTETERSTPDFYKKGQVVQFHQNAMGFKAGSRWNVKGKDPFGNVMVTPDTTVEKQLHLKPPSQFPLKSLPLGKSDRFEVYEKSKIEIAPGDLLQITRSGKTFSVTESVWNEATGASKHPTRDLGNGSTVRVKRFTKDGNLHLDNGLIVPKDYGHFEHGYCVTSFAAQSKAADRVIVAHTERSAKGMTKEALYTSVSRGRESVAVYTDNTQSLLEAVGRNATRMSAMSLMRENGTDDFVKHGVNRAKESERQRQSSNQDRGKQQRGFDREL